MVDGVFHGLRWLKWKIRGEGTVHSSLAPVYGCGIAFKVGPAVLSNQAFNYFLYFTLVPSRKMHKSMPFDCQLMCYKVGSQRSSSIPLTVTLRLWEM